MFIKPRMQRLLRLLRQPVCLHYATLKRALLLPDPVDLRVAVSCRERSVDSADLKCGLKSILSHNLASLRLTSFLLGLYLEHFTSNLEVGTFIILWASKSYWIFLSDSQLFILHKILAALRNEHLTYSGYVYRTFSLVQIKRLPKLSSVCGNGLQGI